ncbi:unnamed protein product [Kuraishia capsulata CBS 1993]|uniref:MoaB/Mog domain-containing protein n=1 Tax=Kuraishia capsulata CBS 1993 TaxID=1382522 RepID=W6MXP0_9ASCO|nr:uncharacterized protein KUCA_T00005213001 [Kuraishia capsulata CBS 1993]CDK29225.1 unnamed protein product [Kuraishia capsulata CBS 1993]
MFKVGVIVVSDSCYKDRSLDKVIPCLEKFFKDHTDYSIAKAAIIPDSVDDIQYIVSKWSEESEDLRLILTSGGTGFTVRDNTPEAVKPLIQREAPGIVHAMLSESFKITRFAMMARPVAGVRKKSLIITLPGSPKAVLENLGSVFPTISHALTQIENVDSRALHRKMARTLDEAAPGGKLTSEHDHHHNHHDHEKPDSRGRVGCGIAKHKMVSNDLDAPVTQRARESPFPMVSVEESYKLISQHTPESEAITMNVQDDLFVGSVVAEDVLAPVSVPNFRASIVDGYAVVSSDGPGKYPVVSISHASGSNKPKVLASGQIARVTTGAPVPEGADAVVMVEETRLVSKTDDGSEEKEVEILATGVTPADNVRAVGSDLKEGSLILAKGTVIGKSGGEVGILASVGISKIKVYRKPKLGVLSTGDELVDLQKKTGELSYGQIYDSNRPTLLSTIRQTGFEVVDLGIALDSQETLASQLAKALDSDIDYLITTGGVSMGELDLLKPTIERVLNGTIHFGRVKMKPGKPTTFATVTAKGKTKVIFALPGNPASASVCYHVFVLPSLLLNSGSKPVGDEILPQLPLVKVKLAASTRLDPRPEYQRARVTQIATNGVYELVATVTGFQRSSRIASFATANAILVLPSSAGRSPQYEAGTLCDALLLGPVDIV